MREGIALRYFRTKHKASHGMTPDDKEKYVKISKKCYDIFSQCCKNIWFQYSCLKLPFNSCTFASVLHLPIFIPWGVECIHQRKHPHLQCTSLLFTIFGPPLSSKESCIAWYCMGTASMVETKVTWHFLPALCPYKRVFWTPWVWIGQRASISRNWVWNGQVWRHKQVFLEPHLIEQLQGSSLYHLISLITALLWCTKGWVPFGWSTPAVKKHIMYRGCNPKPATLQVPNMTNIEQVQFWILSKRFSGKHSFGYSLYRSMLPSGVLYIEAVDKESGK